MGNWRDHWRILFGRTPVKLKGAFSYDETIQRLDLVLSRRFVSSHFKRTLSGGPNEEGRLEFRCDYNFYFWRHVVEQRFRRLWGYRLREIPMSTGVRFIGDLEIDKGGYVWLQGALQAPVAERIGCLFLLLILIGGVLLLPWAFARGTAAFMTIVLAWIVLPVGLLTLTIRFQKETADKLNQMLKLVMSEPLE